MTDSLRAMNINLMVSVWPSLTNWKLEKQYQFENSILGNTNFLDFYDDGVQKRFCQMLKESMFNFGVRSIWLDATEPELVVKDYKTKTGPFTQVALPYSLLVAKAAFEGYRKDFPDKRVFNLTRSAFAGQQRYAAAIWSGDVKASWEQYREQIALGLHGSMAGYPYSCTDIGGFFRDGNQYKVSGYNELLTRWFQYGSFCPIFRVHGYGSETEIWNHGQGFEQTARSYISYRYRLMPYIYATACQITNKGQSMMEPLVARHALDKANLDLYNQFFFGPSLKVCPVTKPGLRNRTVYLPEIYGMTCGPENHWKVSVK